MIQILPIETLKIFDGLTFRAKAPDGAAFSRLAVPAQDILYGCFFSNPRARVASRWALIMLVLSLSTDSLSRHGSSCLKTTANDDVVSCCAYGPYPASVTPINSSRHL